MDKNIIKTENKRDRIVTAFLTQAAKVQLIKESLKRRRSMSEMISFIVDDWLATKDRKLSIDNN